MNSEKCSISRAGDEEDGKSSSNYSSARDDKEQGEFPEIEPHDEQGDQGDDESLNSLDDDNPSSPQNNGRPQRDKGEGHKAPSWSGNKPPWALKDGLEYFQAASREARVFSVNVPIMRCGWQ